MLQEEVVFAGPIKGALLDAYLLHGWYRMGFLIFTTHYISVTGDGKQHRACWLRYKVKDVKPNKHKTKLLSANKHLSIACELFVLTEEIDALHKKYVASLKFNTSKDLDQLLQDTNNEIYDSNVITLRDNGKLVGCGIFDRGEHSIAGIINFYDPEYKKQSLGKFLMLQKYNYCVLNDINYYYPGYYMPDHPLFDYKLFLDKAATEVYLPETNEWVRYNEGQAATSDAIIL
ncbi:MAG: arginine-tRNA-protein transferase [Chitinophagaceae bacterium]|nr:arginine-tRNA-protein transferase [Chitinophagaceae bacterium]